MQRSHPLTLVAPRQHLLQLTIIRSLLLAFLWIGLVCSLWFATTDVTTLVTVLLVLTAVNLVTYLRLKNELVVTEIEFFCQLLIDVIVLNTLFYFSGGASNPFISYLLVPVCISAATLPWRFTWCITGISLLAYSCLLFVYVDFPLFAVDHQHMHHGFNWHILGMWFNFFISAILITYFVVKMADTLRRQENRLSQLREDELRDEQLMAVAMLAAGTAHEINTPLSTMTVLLSELREEYKNNTTLLPDLDLLSQQVSQCASTLKRLVNDSSLATRGDFKSQSAQDFCESLLDRWRLMRPHIPFTVTYSGDNLMRAVALDPRLDQAIINLLNNAADASPHSVIIEICVNTDAIRWKIMDQGPGIQHTIRNTLGKQTYTTKKDGLGLGMVLTHATLKHCGGRVTQYANQPLGTITEFEIPFV